MCLSLCVCTHTFVHSGISDSATPWTVVRQAPLSMEFSRQAYWSRLLFPTPRDETCVYCTSCTGRRMLRPCTAWKLPVVLPFPECHINTESFWVKLLLLSEYIWYSSIILHVWDGWMASLTRWTWVSVNSGSWWWTGRPGVLRFVGSKRVGHDWTELNFHYWIHSQDKHFPGFSNYE